MEKRKQLSERARAILDYINTYLAQHGHEPGYSEICKHVGIQSKGTVARYIAEIEKHGLLQQNSQPLR